MKKQQLIKNIELGKLVHGGQSITETADGKKLFVLGGLPGELVDVRITKKKSSYLEGIVETTHTASVDRIVPVEPLSYLSTSPWQIMNYATENRSKEAILSETFEREGVDGIAWTEFYAGDERYHYRNKQEFGFWGDEKGLHLAHFVRGSHGKQIVEGSVLATESINQSARQMRDELQKMDIWAGKIKTLLLRSSEAGQVVGALFVKEELDFSAFVLPSKLQGLDVYYSDPKSPASVPTKKLYSLGDITLSDSIVGKHIIYDVMSFFQVNLPVFVRVLQEIKKVLGTTSSVDLYSGVGTIGIACGSKKLVESDDYNVQMAKLNAESTYVEVIHASSEAALEHITDREVVIIDPPRAGLHKEVIERLQAVKPPKIIYLSCNPSTQARDVKMLEGSYKVTYAQGFNFFPATPHIESLIVLELQ